MKKSAILFSFFLISFLTIFALLQQFVIKDQKIFLSYDKFLPDFYLNLVEGQNKAYQTIQKAVEHSLKKHEPVMFPGKNYAYLQKFYLRLLASQKLKENKQSKKPLRIFHYGDSLIWGDIISNVVRDKFQEKFGDGGVGFIPVLNDLATKVDGHTNLTPKYQFTQRRILPGSESIDRQLGFNGEGYISYFPKLKFLNISSKKNRSFDYTQIYFHHFKPKAYAYLYPPKEAQAMNSLSSFFFDHSIVKSNLPNENLNYKKIPHKKKYLKKNQKICGAVEISGFNTYSQNFTLETLQPQKNIFPYFSFSGFTQEKRSGISYSAIVRTGVKIFDLLDIDPKIFHCEIRLLDPALLIFQFGVNESEHMSWRDRGGLKPEVYEKLLFKFLEQAKAAIPNGSVMLIGPPERLKMKFGVLQAMPEIPMIIAIQRRVTEKLKVAYFSSYQHFGGVGHMKILHQKGMASSDYTHLRYSGADHLGAGIFKELYNGYVDFNGLHKQKLKQEKFNRKVEKNKAILFNSKAFAYFFISILFLTGVFLRYPRTRILILLAASYYFYMTWKIWPILLIVFSSLIDFVVSKGVFALKNNNKKNQGKQKLLLLISLFSNLGLLFFFKYITFIGLKFTELFAKGTSMYSFGVDVLNWNILLPVGISFYTFQTLSYTIDVYRGKFKKSPTLREFAFYVAFFPQLVAGPIVRAKDFFSRMKPIEKTSGKKHGPNEYPIKVRRVFNQPVSGWLQKNIRQKSVALKHFRVTKKIFQAGLFLIIAGLLKKLGADYLGINMVDRVFDNPGMYSISETLFAIYGYGLQIYGDFSGYSDIAIGSALLLGYHLPLNFNRPYKAISISDFWRRWHISLSSWLRDYLYIPLGGNRKRLYFNIMVTMFFCGMWHGAGFNFIFWGLYNGLLMVFERFTGLDKNHTKNKLTKFLRWFTTFHLILFGWIIFRSQSLQSFKAMFINFTDAKLTFNQADISILAVIVIAFLWHLLPNQVSRNVKARFIQSNAWLVALVYSLFLQIFYQISSTEIRSFIYSQF